MEEELLIWSFRGRGRYEPFWYEPDVSRRAACQQHFARVHGVMAASRWCVLAPSPSPHFHSIGLPGLSSPRRLWSRSLAATLLLLSFSVVTTACFTPHPSPPSVWPATWCCLPSCSSPTVWPATWCCLPSSSPLLSSSVARSRDAARRPTAPLPSFSVAGDMVLRVAPLAAVPKDAYIALVCAACFRRRGGDGSNPDGDGAGSSILHPTGRNCDDVGLSLCAACGAAAFCQRCVLDGLAGSFLACGCEMHVQGWHCSPPHHLLCNASAVQCSEHHSYSGGTAQARG